MNLITTVPANRQFDIGVFSFGAMPAANPSSINLTIKHSGTVVTGFYLSQSSSLVSLSLPNIVAIDPANLQGGGFSIQQCHSCTSLSVPLLCSTGGDIIAVNSGVGTLSYPSLGTCGGDFANGDASTLRAFSAPGVVKCGRVEFVAATDCWSFPSLTTVTGPLNPSINGNSYQGTNISMPLLSTTGANGIIASFCPNVNNINVPHLIMTNGASYIFTTDPQLPAATVNALLARGVASTGFVSGQLLLSGAAPTGQGITDKATLQGRGVTVVTS